MDSYDKWESTVINFWKVTSIKCAVIWLDWPYFFVHAFPGSILNIFGSSYILLILMEMWIACWGMPKKDMQTSGEEIEIESLVLNHVLFRYLMLTWWSAPLTFYLSICWWKYEVRVEYVGRTCEVMEEEIGSTTTFMKHMLILNYHCQWRCQVYFEYKLTSNEQN